MKVNKWWQSFPFIPLSMSGRWEAHCCPCCLLFSLCVVFCICLSVTLSFSSCWVTLEPLFLPSGSMHPAEGAALSRWQNASQWNYVDLSSVTDGAQREIINAFSCKVISKADVWSLVCFPFNLSFFKTSSQMLFVNISTTNINHAHVACIG